MSAGVSPDLDYQSVFRAMGCTIRLVIGPPMPDHQPPADVAAESQRSWIEDFAARLTRFDPASELARFNRDTRTEVPASPLLRAAVRAGLWAAERSGGLVDPFLMDEIERAGYADSQIGRRPEPLAEALADAPPRRPARPRADGRRGEVEIDDAAGVVRRPPGLRFDTGGVGKGLAADAVAHRLSGHRRFAVDCGGDLTIGGSDPARARYAIQVQHPLFQQPVETLLISGGSVATSGLSVHLWRRDDGTPAHHLLDPATGEPAWTGVIAATAVAPSALEAETLSKMALLSGPDRAREVLSEYGGITFLEDGDYELIGPLPLQGAMQARFPALRR